MLVNTQNNLTYISNQLEDLITQKASGVLEISYQGKLLLQIYLYSGRLQYVVEENHRVRRWQRHIKRNCTHWKIPEMWPENEPWEYELLANGISKKELTLNQVKAVITGVAKECLFEVSQKEKIDITWESLEKQRSALAYCLTLSSAEIHPLFADVEHITSQCDRMKLKNLNPSLSPIKADNLDEVSLTIASRYFNGSFTLWDICEQSKMSLTKVISELSPLIKNKKIKLKQLEDISSPHQKKHSKRTQKSLQPVKKDKIQSSNKKEKLLVACIDDSPVVGYNLKQILSRMGYDVLTIQEPMTGFGELIKNKPDLILLDLNMPNANGYSVCKFLRETPIFHKTPIIILTSQDTMIDRTRAKLAGATDFLAKPPEAAVLLQMLNNLLVH